MGRLRRTRKLVPLALCAAIAAVTAATIKGVTQGAA